MIAKLQERSPLKQKAVRDLSSLDPCVFQHSPQLGQKRFSFLLEELNHDNIINDVLAENAKKEYLHFCNLKKSQLQEIFCPFDQFSDEYYSYLQGPSESDQTQKHIHPAVKKLIGKQPRHTLWQSLDQRSSKYRQATNDNYSKIASDNLSSFENANDTSQNQVDDRAAKVTKVPRYIPPRPSEHNIETQIGLSRNFRHKIKQRLILGNISKWIPIDSREDEASHKWMVYVRGPQELPDISPFVSKIRFFLHPSYKPHDVVEVTSHPFHLCRRGWGEFPVRIQVHFTHHLNKPVDLIHHLKLDRSYTGLQRLGCIGPHQQKDFLITRIVEYAKCRSSDHTTTASKCLQLTTQPLITADTTRSLPLTSYSTQIILVRTVLLDLNIHLPEQTSINYLDSQPCTRTDQQTNYLILRQDAWYTPVTTSRGGSRPLMY
uniref:YEATS domain-containing protein n=1 Tax=Timema monikensis TaxID=170555 RepID=A0A7R9HUU0_9NEOP|nr:unnamed protein product [Timema monikensis]